LIATDPSAAHRDDAGSLGLVPRHQAEDFVRRSPRYGGGAGGNGRSAHVAGERRLAAWPAASRFLAMLRQGPEPAYLLVSHHHLETAILARLKARSVRRVSSA
jgi:hypothetical protein